MNKTELINSLTEETALPKRDVVRMLDTLARIVGRTLKKGDKVQWSGFGTFTISRRPPRIGINPITREKIQLPATLVMKFRPGKNFKEDIRSAR